MHSLFVIHRGERRTKGKNITQKEGANVLATSLIADLSVDLVSEITCEVEDSKLPSLA